MSIISKLLQVLKVKIRHVVLVYEWVTDTDGRRWLDRQEHRFDSYEDAMEWAIWSRRECKVFDHHGHLVHHHPGHHHHGHHDHDDDDDHYH
jgi:hypothetical protein